MVIEAIGLGSLLFSVITEDDDPYRIHDRYAKYRLLNGLGAWNDGIVALLDGLPDDVAIEVLRGVFFEPLRQAKNLDDVIDGVTRWLAGLAIVDYAITDEHPRFPGMQSTVREDTAYLASRVRLENKPWLQVQEHLCPAGRRATEAGQIELPSFGTRPKIHKWYWITGQKKKDLVQDISPASLSADLRMLSWDDQRIFAIDKQNFIDPWGLALVYVDLYTLDRAKFERAP